MVSDDDTIYPSDFPENMQKHKKRSDYDKVVFEEGRTLREMMNSLEKSLLKQGYAKYKNTTKLAELLDVNQYTIARKLKKYNIYREIRSTDCK